MGMTTLLDNQRIRFDNHKRGQATTKENLHFHKEMFDWANRQIASAEVLIYVDGMHSSWETRGENGERLEKELKNVFDKQSDNNIGEFVETVYKNIVDFGSRPTTDDEKSEIRDNIIKAFYGEEKLEIISSKIDKKFNYKFSMSYIPKDKRFLQTIFDETKKEISLIDKTIRKDASGEDKPPKDR